MNPNDERNAAAIRFLRKRNGRSPLFELPGESAVDPFMGAGSHPDIVERVWRGIGGRRPFDGRCLVCGTPALVDPETGLIVAFALGTQYAVRLSEDAFAKALAAGARTDTTWTGGTVTDLAVEIGPGWIFGAWLDLETL